MTIKKLFRRFFCSIYHISRKILGGRGLRKNPFVNTVFTFVATRGKENLIEVNGCKMYLDVVEGIDPRQTPHEIKTVDLFKREIRKGQTVLDVGADIGYFTCLSARLVGQSGKVFAFEPNPRNVDFIRKNISVNGFYNIYTVEKAVSDKQGEASFFMHGPHGVLGYNRFDNTKTSITVGVISLDDFLLPNRKIDFVKIDTEGSDAKVLRGMRGLLRNNNDIKLVIEFYPALLRMTGDNPQNFLQELVGYGFTLYDIDGEYGVEKPVTISELLNKYGESGITNLFCRRDK